MSEIITLNTNALEASSIPKSKLDSGISEAIDKATDLSLTKGSGTNSVCQTGCTATGAQSIAFGSGTKYNIEIRSSSDIYEYRNSVTTPKVNDVIEYDGGYALITVVNTSSKMITLDSIPYFSDWTSAKIVRGVAYGKSSHSEGSNTIASGTSSHVEGSENTASGYGSHAEGGATTASGSYSHSEGRSTTASEHSSHAEGQNTTASGTSSHAEGCYTKTNNRGEHANGNYNKSSKTSDEYGSTGNTSYSHGIGTADNARKNAFEIMQNGEIYICGVGGYDGTNPSSKSNSLQKVLEDLGVTIDWTVLGYSSQS